MKDEVIKFVSEVTAVNVDQITLDTAVNFDLGVDGDDGVEFLEEYSKRFNVDLTSMSDIYFGPEASPVLLIILWPYYLVRWMSGYKSNALVPLRVSQLIKSAESGTWIN